VKPAGARGLVPPRPNLGPEPWSASKSVIPFTLFAAIVISVLLAWFVRRVLVRRRLGKQVGELSNQDLPDSSPRGQLLAHSAALRDVLAHQFGSSWRAKTTEELAGEPGLAHRLGFDQLTELIRFLDQTDRLKFAPERSSQNHDCLAESLAAWEPRLTAFKMRIASRPEEGLNTHHARIATPTSPTTERGVQGVNSYQHSRGNGM
jgi:hypothetical protein